jgi:adenylylsulfate kinase-like enzyme
MVIWFTGISGSGKTTLGKKFFEKLKRKSKSTIYLDGDKFREIFKNDLGYSLSDRDMNAYRLTRLVKEISSQKINIVVAANLTNTKYRSWCRKNIKSFREVHIEAKIDSLLSRDYKNLYNDALKGRIKNVVGVDLLFKKPKGCYMYIENNSTKKDFYKKYKKNFFEYKQIKSII